MPDRFRVAFPRAHVLTPQEWGYSAGTDFWIVGSANGMLTATNAHELSDYGWTTTALSLANGQAADFLSQSDQGDFASVIAFDAASDLLKSPSIFGNFAHAQMAEMLLYRAPTKLVLEGRWAYSVASNNEPASAVGFVEDGGSPIVADDALAMIASNGTNFILRSGAASDAGAAIDTAYHLWEIELDSATGLAAWSIDGVAQGSIAITADEFPVAFGAGIVAAGSNNIQLAWAHVYYDYARP